MKKNMNRLLALFLILAITTSFGFSALASENVKETDEVVSEVQEEKKVEVEEKNESDDGDASAEVLSETQSSTFSLWPSKSSLSFVEDNYTAVVGESVYITAVYVCEQTPTDFVWECNEESAVSFSATSTMGPVETGKENTYWISVTATAIKEGNYTVTLAVKAKSAWTAEATAEISITEAPISGYTVLILDGSGSMSGTPKTKQREAAVKFCQSMLSATGNNQVAIVELNSTSSAICDFSDNLDSLTSCIDSISASGGTNMNQALIAAKELLDCITDSPGIIKNIVLCSDGLPESGSTSASGPYTSYDHYDYRYGNVAYNTATSIKESSITIYTLGFFHNLSGKDLTFGKQLMTDIATSVSCYYEVTNVEELEFTFGEIAGEIMAEPVSITITSSTYLGATNGIIQYLIYAEITNNSKTTDLTNVFVQLDEGDDADIITEHGEWQQTEDVLKANQSAKFSWVISIDTSNYPDGGAYYFIVYAGSDQTVTSSAQSSIAIAATNGESNRLDFWTDVWNFQNFLDNKHHIDEITADDQSALLARLSPSEYATMQKELYNAGDKGHCFGMSLTTILSKMNIFDISDYSDASCLRDANLTDQVHSILCYYQSLVVLDSFTADMQNFLLKAYDLTSDGEYQYSDRGVAEQLTILAEKADAVQSGGSPVLLSFGCNGWGAHAVVAYETESGRWEWSGETYNKRIYLYDCNVAKGDSKWWTITGTDFNPIWDAKYCLYFNEGTDEWIIPAYSTYEEKDKAGNVTETRPCMVSTNYENTYISQACNDLTILNTKNYDASLYNYIAELRCQNETAMRLENSNSQYIIMGKSGSIAGDTDLVTYYDDDAISNESNISTLNVILPNENADYTFSTLSGKAEPLDFHIKDEDFFFSVEASAAKGSAFAINDEIALLGNEGSYKVKIADDNIEECKFNTYTVSGKNTGNTTVKLDDDGILITSDELIDMTIIGSNSKKEAEINFSTEEDSVLVVSDANNDKLLVLIDEDNDGDYESILKDNHNDDGGDNDTSNTITITVPSSGNGTITVTPSDAKEGDIVTITVTPNEGYELDNLTVTDEKDNMLTLIDNGDGTYSFTMPASNVTIDATFEIETQGKSESTTDTGKNSGSADNINVNTGDNAMIWSWMIILIVSVIGLVVIILVIKRKKSKK